MKHAVVQRNGPIYDYAEIAEGLCYKLFFRFGGRTVLFATDSAVAQARLRTAYGNFLTPEPGRPAVTVALGSVAAIPAHRRYLSYSDGDWVVASDGHPTVLYESDENRATFAAIGILHHLLIRLLAKDAVVFHAAVLRRGDQTVLIPGRAGIGKSTLAASLVGIGFQLLSDELAPVDPVTMSIEPCPLPIGLRNNGVPVDPAFRGHVVATIRHKIGDEDRTIYELERSVVATGPAVPTLLVMPTPDASHGSVDEVPGPATIVPHLLRASYNDPIELRTFDTCIMLAALPAIRVGRTSPEINAQVIESALDDIARGQLRQPAHV